MEPNLSTVRARRAQINKLRKALDTEDHELEIAEAVLTRLAAHHNVDIVPSIPQSNGTTTAIQQPVTQRDLVIATLRTLSDPWIDSSANLLTEINSVHGASIKPSSLLPLLTALKNEGVIRRDGANRIALAERVG